jgi:hypothetical protein
MVRDVIRRFVPLPYPLSSPPDTVLGPDAGLGPISRMSFLRPTRPTVKLGLESCSGFVGNHAQELHLLALRARELVLFVRKHKDV